MINEIWRTIPNHPNYEASNLGRIRRGMNGRVVKQLGSDVRNYQVVTIWTNKKKYTKKVARLVWSAFNDCECDKTVDHIDRNKLNNTITNLRCISNKENLENRTIYREKNKYQITLKDKITIIQNYRMKVWSTWDIAKKYGIPSNYLHTTFQRGSWDKLWKKQQIKDTENI